MTDRRGAARAMLLALVVAAAAIPGCKRAGGVGAGDLAPEFVLPRLDGTVQKLSNYRGNVVLVNLWATWCPPCIEEMPVLDRISSEYRDRGLVLLGLAGDDDPERVRAFLEKSPVDFEVLLDQGGEVGTRYGITAYPETFVIDRDGRVITKFVGPLPAGPGGPSAEVRSVIEAALARGA